MSNFSPFFPPLRDMRLSMEFFPPGTEALEASLWRAIGRLEPLKADFVSVTYGAGGSTRTRTHKTIRRILTETSLTPAAHLTCVGASRGEVDDIAREYWDLGVRHIVALRGDPPEGHSRYTPHPEGYENAAALVAGLKRVADFEISVAAYPESHPDSPNRQADIDNLKAKFDAGANQAITQFFFDADLYLHLRDETDKAGITGEIIPGILPISNIKQVQRFADSCNATIPHWISNLFKTLEGQPETMARVSALLSAELCNQLYDHGVRRFHIYTLNRSNLCLKMAALLGQLP